MGNKEILMSIKPQYVAKILNGEKTIEVRKKFPKDYVGWVYIYCTKGNWKKCLGTTDEGKYDYGIHEYINYPYAPKKVLNGKVVARFWCDKVEEIQALRSVGHFNDELPTDYETPTECDSDLFLKKCCISKEYLDSLNLDVNNAFAIHITKLKIFDKPKEIKDFYKVGAWKVFEEQFDSSYLKREQQEIMEELEQTITKAPQSWCYVED